MIWRRESRSSRIIWKIIVIFITHKLITKVGFIREENRLHLKTELKAVWVDRDQGQVTLVLFIIKAKVKTTTFLAKIISKKALAAQEEKHHNWSQTLKAIDHQLQELVAEKSQFPKEINMTTKKEIQLTCRTTSTTKRVKTNQHLKWSQ